MVSCDLFNNLILSKCSIIIGYIQFNIATGKREKGVTFIMSSKLVLVEGLPGFGKTTTARLVHDILTEMNLKSQLFLEGDLEHPADYDGVAYFNEHEFNTLLIIFATYSHTFLHCCNIVYLTHFVVIIFNLIS